MDNGPDFTKKLDNNSGSLLLEKIGWENARQKGEVLDENFEIIPWYCYSMVFFLKERLTKNMSVFEYGSGFSTLFYAKKVEFVISSEVNLECKNWLENEAKNQELYNLKIENFEGEEFVKSIQKHEKQFDLIVVDSILRNDCIKFCIDFLSNQGVVLLDNSERNGYKKSFEYLKSIGFKALTFTGIKPLSTKFASSTLFYKQENIFNL